jgi:hypothetical protein
LYLLDTEKSGRRTVGGGIEGATEQDGVTLAPDMSEWAFPLLHLQAYGQPPELDCSLQAWERMLSATLQSRTEQIPTMKIVCGPLFSALRPGRYHADILPAIAAAVPVPASLLSALLERCAYEDLSSGEAREKMLRGALSVVHVLLGLQALL